jgi:uncharacterized protein YwqG
MGTETTELAAKLMVNPGLWGMAGEIEKLARSSIRLTAKPAAQGALPAGVSHLGGLPDLPAGTAWPMWKSTPLAFIAQVRLEEAAPFDPQGYLPKSGLLSFFYDAQQDTYGADPADRGGWQVLYHRDDPSSWQPLQPPSGLPAEALFKPCPVTFTPELTLPTAPAQVQPELKWSEAQIKHYEQFLKSFPTHEDHGTLHHRMLGYPEQIQDDMQAQCALMANGVKSIDDPRAGELLKGKADWQLLFQVDSDYNAGMKWATSGLLYYWIERQALAEARFDHTWLVLQAE